MKISLNPETGLKLVLCDGLEGWDGEGGKGSREDICTTAGTVHVVVQQKQHKTF